MKKMIQMNLPAPPQPSSALGRPLDPRYPSNLIAVFGSGAAVLFFFIYNLMADDPLPTSAISAGFTVFLAWAISRELDPDHNASAYVAMLLAFVSVLFVTASPLFGFGVLIGTRLATGTVGLRVGRRDLPFVVGFGALLGSGVNSLAAVAALVIGILVIDRYSRRSLATAVVTVVAAAAVFAIRSPAIVWGTPGAWDLALGLGVRVSLGLSIPARQPATLTDVRGREILAKRVTISRFLVAGCIAAAFVITGASGLQAAFAVAGVSLVATAIVNVAARMVPGSRTVEA
jgi:hypothetical protein